MKPEEIESREFFVSMRGYDRGEVRAFLREVASAHRVALGLEEGEPTAEVDPIEQLGQHVASVVRAADVAAENIRRDAELAAEQVRNEAEHEAQQVLAEARARAQAVDAEAAQRGQAAEQALTVAQEEAARLLEETERLLEQSEREAQERAEMIVTDALERRDAVLETVGRITEVLQGTVADARQQLVELEPESEAEEELTPGSAALPGAERPDPWDAWSDAR